MKKIFTKNTVKAVAFLLVFASLFISLDAVLKFKYSESIIPVKAFYEQEEDTIDVLIVGSSHSYSDFRPDILWNNYGYSAYVLGASLQPMWNSYYYIEEALKTQSPEVIILEGYRLAETKEYTTPYYAIKNTYGLRWSETKYNAMAASFEPDKLSEYIFEFSNYHSRYSDLSKGDFTPYINNEYYRYYKGEICETKTYELPETDISGYSDKAVPLAEKTQEYYIKILELAKANNIELITVVAPYNMPAHEYGYFKTGEKIAESYGMPFINGNELYEELELDFASDFRDEYGHLNDKGAAKITKYVGDFIKDNYNLTDRRNDSRYASWQTYAEEFNRYVLNPVKNSDDITEYISICEKQNDYSYVFVINSYDKLSEYLSESINTVLTQFGIPAENITDGIYVIKNSKVEYFSSSTDVDKALQLDSDYSIRLKYGDVSFNMPTLNRECFYVCINNNKNIHTTPLGITMIVYDNKYNKLVESISLLSDIDSFERNTQITVATK